MIARTPRRGAHHLEGDLPRIYAESRREEVRDFIAAHATINDLLEAIGPLHPEVDVVAVAFEKAAGCQHHGNRTIV